MVGVTIDLRGAARSGNDALDAAKDQLVQQSGCGWTHTLAPSDPLPASLLLCARLLSVNQMECYELQGRAATLAGVVSPRNELETHALLRAMLRGLIGQHTDVARAALARLAELGAAYVGAPGVDGTIEPSRGAVDELQALLMRSGAVGLDRVGAGEFADTTGRGLFALSDVVPAAESDADDTLLGIPEAWLVTAKAALRTAPFGAVLKAIEGLDDDTRLFLFAIYDAKVNRGYTRWRAYWDAMPATFSTPLQMAPDDLALLRGTVLHGAVQQAVAQLEQIHAALFPLLSQHYPTLFPPAVFTMDTFRWAKSLLDSRALRVLIDGELTTCLVPWVDLLNHRSNAHCWRRRFDDKRRLLRVEANMPVAAGEQIFLSYGPLRNWELLQDYGFVLAGNPYDSFAIEFDAPSDGKRAAAKLLQKHGLTSDHHFRLGQPPTPSCLAYLRVVVADDADLRALSRDGLDPRAGPVSARNEREMCALLRHTAQFLLEQFHPAAADDTLGPGAGPLARLAHAFAKDQRAIVQSLVVWVDAQT